MQPHALVNKPSIMLYVCGHAGYEQKIREIEAGIEEEGVPCSLVLADEPDAVVLARLGAQRSPLGVGIGVGSAAICIHYHKLPENQPLFLTKGGEKPQEWRLFGYNAARLIKGIPFKQGQAEQTVDSLATAGLMEDIRQIVLQVLQETAKGHGG